MPPASSPTPSSLRKKHAFRTRPRSARPRAVARPHPEESAPGSATGTFIPARTLSAPVTVVISFPYVDADVQAVRGGMRSYFTHFADYNVRNGRSLTAETSIPDMVSR